MTKLTTNYWNYRIINVFTTFGLFCHDLTMYILASLSILEAFLILGSQNVINDNTLSIEVTSRKILIFTISYLSIIFKNWKCRISTVLVFFQIVVMHDIRGIMRTKANCSKIMLFIYFIYNYIDICCDMYHMCLYVAEIKGSRS